MPKLAWNGKEISGWVCDGKELKPKFGASLSNTWVFDGKEIKPKSGANLGNTWVWNGKELKPKSGANLQNTWDIGNAPILVIAGCVALRLY